MFLVVIYKRRNAEGIR